MDSINSGNKSSLSNKIQKKQWRNITYLYKDMVLCTSDKYVRNNEENINRQNLISRKMNKRKPNFNISGTYFQCIRQIQVNKIITIRSSSTTRETMHRRRSGLYGNQLAYRPHGPGCIATAWHLWKVPSIILG